MSYNFTIFSEERVINISRNVWIFCHTSYRRISSDCVLIINLTMYKNKYEKWRDKKNLIKDFSLLKVKYWNSFSGEGAKYLGRSLNVSKELRSI